MSQFAGKTHKASFLLGEVTLDIARVLCDRKSQLSGDVFPLYEVVFQLSVLWLL